MVGLASRPSFENMISYNPTFVSAVMICWPGRLDQGEALDGTMPKSKKGPHGKTTRCDLIGCHAPDVDDQVYAQAALDHLR